MKIVTLIMDGRGRLRLIATCAPDLLRREFAAETGSAHLIWCGVPPADRGARAIVAEVRDRFDLDPSGCLLARPERVVQLLLDTTLAAPRRRERLRKLKQLYRRGRRAFGRCRWLIFG